MTCEQEPIRIPGAIQPHGVLVAAHESDLAIVAVSANLATIGGIAAAALGAPLSTLFDETSIARVAGFLAHPDPAASAMLPVRLENAPGGQRQLAVLHRHDGLAILEFESQAAEPVPATDELFPLLSAAICKTACKFFQIPGLNSVQ